jgi:hypothetical protein
VGILWVHKRYHGEKVLFFFSHYIFDGYHVGIMLVSKRYHGEKVFKI